MEFIRTGEPGFFSTGGLIFPLIPRDACNYSNRMNNLLDQFSPRFSLSYEMIADKVFLNFNAGSIISSRHILPWVCVTIPKLVNAASLDYISCDHLVLGVEYHPSSVSKISAESS